MRLHYQLNVLNKRTSCSSNVSGLMGLTLNKIASMKQNHGVCQLVNLWKLQNSTEGNGFHWLYLVAKIYIYYVCAEPRCT